MVVTIIALTIVLISSFGLLGYITFNGKPMDITTLIIMPLLVLTIVVLLPVVIILIQLVNIF